MWLITTGYIFLKCVNYSMNLKNDIIEDSAMEIEWNLMPLKEQQMYKYLVMNVQDSRCLTIGGLAPLNWPTCVQVSNKFYSLNDVDNYNFAIYF